MPSESPHPSRKGLLFVTSGPSGSGKTTLCRMVEAHLHIPHNVSYTTRTPRAGEQNGRDYYFISDEQFEGMLREDRFAEWAEVHGKRYGTAKKDIEKKIDQGEDIILDLDTQGALAIKKRYPEAFLIFIDVQDQILRSRLEHRGTESELNIEKRLAQVQHERRMSLYYDYVLQNDELKQAFQDLVDFILKKRRS
ncbi:MAG: guanylate kinase [Deltaproteobacteria bacterium]|nr:guanylate kinase [Deltaproteobacteria bacterium]